MVGQQDVELVQQLVESAPEGTRFVELGPWLGHLTRLCACKGPVTAIDTFVWSGNHDKRVPGLLAPGESFRDIVDAANASAPHPITLQECDIAAFDWNGAPFDFCLIDAPKTADKLAVALARLLPHLAPDAPVVVINGRNLKHAGMIGFIVRCVSAGLLRWDETRPLGKSKLALLRRGDITRIESILSEAMEATALASDALDAPGMDDPLNIASVMANLAQANQWTDAYRLLDRAGDSTAVRTFWEQAEAAFDLAKVDVEQLGHFSHMVDASHTASVSGRPARALHKNAIDAIEEFWFRNANKDWRADAFHPAIIARAQSMGYLDWPSEIGGRLTDKRVLDVGCGSGLHGIGVLAAGASHYLGIDPELKLRSDKVKDLVKKTKIQFGHCPDELMGLMPPLQFMDCTIQELATGETPYDVALMHMVTQHLQDLEAAIAATARQLAPGGHLILRHKNFNAWNGHQIAPNTIDDIDLGNPEHMQLVDWRHLDFEPPSDHYIARKLNRVSLSRLRDTLEHHFDIEIWLPKQPTKQQGLGRLTDEIRAAHPGLQDEDFETQTVFCVAKRR